MPLFVILTTDKPDSLELRMSTRPPHLEYLNGLGARMKAAGPFLSADDKPVGSLIIVEADDLTAAQALADNDPYARAGLFASVEVRPWRLGVGGFAG